MARFFCGRCGKELGDYGGCPRCGSAARRLRTADGREVWGGAPWWAAAAIAGVLGYLWGWNAAVGSCAL
ncbi:MAG: hypothetical protein GC160_02830 [Acidobacteria bacterium]|nr:hypothetical protein [Acidobacteriota bacterium]